MLKYSLAFLLLFIQFVTVNLTNFIQDTETIWNTAILSSYITAMISCAGWFFSLDNKSPKLKCIILFETLYLFTEILTFPLALLPTGAVFDYCIEAIRGLGLATWLGYVILRKGEATPSELNDKDIFAVRSKTSGFQDYLLALLNKYELGSYGLYYKGNYYHYRHGVMVKDSKRLLQAKKENLVTIKSKPYDKETISKIEKLVGTRWSIVNNCYTRIRPLLKKVK